MQKGTNIYFFANENVFSLWTYGKNCDTMQESDCVAFLYNRNAKGLDED